ncbi:MAG TPA: hypothetical protein VJX67_03030, partial [Blastocatellia bacterium]|nr:hypothetical protein [Blastocatellia bacterium]
RFSDLPTTHFARWVIVPDDKEKGIQSSLAFEANFDGSLDEYLDGFAKKAGSGLDQIYGKCIGYPSGGTADVAAFKRYVRAHSVTYSARYIAYRGRNVKDIHNNTRVRDLVETFLDAEDRKGALDKLSASALKDRIGGFLSQEKTTEPGLQTQPLEISNGWRPIILWAGLIAIALLFLPVWIFWVPLPLIARLILFFAPLLLLGIYAIWLRVLERKDQQISVKFVTIDDAIFHRENRQVQNQLTHLVDIKPGLFRLFTLKVVLGVINFAAKFYYYKGLLGSIPTIHFARWVIIDNNKRLIFFSNFDGSWENYLGDFIDKAAVGLTGVWSNTVAFPKTEFLVFKGATDEERFKEWARAKQIPTQVWYTAHPDETVKNILDNFSIRNAVERPLSGDEAKAWLQLF